MNKLEKFFNTLNSNNSKLIKKYTTEELCFQIKEYIDFTPYICKNIYKLLISRNLDDRLNGAEILKSIMFQFKLVTDFIIEFQDNKDEYLSSTGEEFEGKKLSLSEQKRLLKKMTDLEHVETNIVNEIDFKADSRIVIKKQKILDKPINNIMDFFENITNNLLNYEWNKRHGAFLAYCAIFESETKGSIEIKIDSSIFLKIYEILISDKFNDFIDDKTTAPVRETAATLLSLIYNRIPRNNIINQLMKFLQNDDWQTQYSGLLALKSLKNYISNKKEFCDNLTKLLNATDEDVKFLAAELLVYFYDYCNKKIVFEKCLENIKDNEEISVSKVSIITLLAKGEFVIEDTTILYNYFTSPVSDVRKSVLKVSEKFDDESLTFLIGELILIDENEEIREEAINILNSKKSLSVNFVNHFLNILSTSLYEPYDKNLFVSYDDSFFTKSGIKSIGINNIFKNRVKLFESICKLGELEIIEDKSETSIGEVFKMLYNKNRTLFTEENIKNINHLIMMNHFVLKIYIKIFSILDIHL
ncbi:tata-binding protein-associated factor 172-like protein [Vairimorpha apis BRL 01]|uniref:Tata-binding protein-associated factor 172-like protein n=1 Tax=Vairimorpha apis BRL 01 TaxID=1037528 RepID=T0MEH2_9MICR|nr:tata-binding protein-associated factor 172-like protein [Vairimorpha apis BRL 01]